MLPDRTAETLEAWLNDYIPIERVSRDRFPRFKHVLDNVCPDAIQINDRFHLIQNLWSLHDRMIKKVLPSRIPKVNIQKDQPLQVQEVPLTKQEERKKENANKRWERALYVKELKRKGYSNRKIALMLNIDRRTVASDLMKKEPSTGNRRKRSKPIDKWRGQVITLEREGYTVQRIYDVISNKGYDGPHSSVRILVAKIRKQSKQGQCPQTTVYYTRKEVRRALWRWSFSKENDNKDVVIVNDILKRYPKMGSYFAFINGFRTAISNRDKEELRDLILYEKGRNDSITKSFIDKLLMDFSSTLHACSFEESNGFVEGNVNRLKTIKRMMYGRASFTLLRIRVLYSNK